MYLVFEPGGRNETLRGWAFISTVGWALAHHEPSARKSCGGILAGRRGGSRAHAACLAAGPANTTLSSSVLRRAHAACLAAGPAWCVLRNAILPHQSVHVRLYYYPAFSCFFEQEVPAAFLISHSIPSACPFHLWNSFRVHLNDNGPASRGGFATLMS